MVAIVGGEGLGLFNTSLNQLNGFGGSGSHRIGNGNDRAYVNAVTGNLVIQSQDDYLAALGLDVSLMRTYNSRGLLNNVNDDNQDLWQLSFYRRLSNLPAAGVTTPITREGGDGHQAVFTYDTTKAYWIATDGSGAHDTLKRVGSEWIYEDTTNGVTEIYDAAGKLSKLRNRDGQLITLGYTDNLVTSLVDGSGQTTTLTYTGNNLTQITTTPSGGSAATRVRYAYDGSNRLIQVKVDLLNPNDTTADATANTYVTTYEYSGTSKRISRITQSDGSELKIGYILVGTEYQIASLQQLHGYNGSTPLYRTTTFNYDTANRRTDVYDNLGAVTSYYYDTANRLTKVVSPQVENGLLSSVSYSYDAKGNITQVTTLVGSGDSRTVSYAYDANGNLTEIRDQLGNTVRRTYNSADQLASETVYLTPDPDGAGTGQPSNGLTTWYVYDAEQHLRYVISPEGRVTHNGYITNGLLATARVWTQEFYRPANPTDASEYTEDKLTAWATALVDKSKAERTDYTYNALGQLLTSTQHAALTTSGAGTGPASVTSYVYSRSGELLSKIEPNPTGTGTATTTYTYDGMGRLLTTQDASGRTSTTLYNDASSTVVVTSDQVSGGAYRLQTTSVYNKAGERISQTQAGGSGTPLGTTLNFYDANGRMRMAQDPTGARVHYLYDTRGRQVGQINAEGELTETVYNGAGQVIRTIRYDGRLTEAVLMDGANPRPLDIAALRGALAAVPGRPVVDLNGTSAAGQDAVVTYPNNGAAMSIVPNVVLSDSNSTNLAGITVTIDNIMDLGQETLSANAATAAARGIQITTAYNGKLGTLTLSSISGARSLADYQAVLATLQYRNAAANPNYSVARQIRISSTDGELGSIQQIATVTVVIAPVMLLNAGTTPSYNENGPAVKIAPNLTLTDPDSSLTGATVSITNFKAGDRLTFSPTTVLTTNGIQASYNASTGVLTLSSTQAGTNRSATQYREVLRAVMYDSTSDDPTTPNATRSFLISASDGTQTASVTATVNVTAVNEAPVISLNGSPVPTYAENGTPVKVVSNLQVSDVDNTSLTEVTVTITNFKAGDRLAFSPTTALANNGIQASYNSSTGVLTLSTNQAGTNRTPAQYQAVLQALVYDSTSDDPTTPNATRSIQITANDGVLTASVTATVNITAANDAPVISLNGSPIPTYTENGTAVTVVPNLQVSDADNTALTGMTVTIANFKAGDRLTFSPTTAPASNGIQASYNSSTGVLTLTTTQAGTNRTPAQYQAVLRAMVYDSTSNDPTNPNASRSIQISASDGALTASVTATVNITAVNDAPLISLNGSPASTYTENDVAVKVAANLSLTDADNASLSGVTVTITNFSAGDRLAFSPASTLADNGIQASYNASTGVLTLSTTQAGTNRSPAQYQAVLRAMVYDSTSENPTGLNAARIIRITANDGALTASVNATVNITPINDPPVLSYNGTPVAYQENAPRTGIINGTIGVIDVDGTKISSATVRLVGAMDAAGEYLFINDAVLASSFIGASYNPATGLLSLTSTQPLPFADYLAVLQALEYQSLSDNPSPTRTVEISVNDGAANSNTITTTINITAVNDAPVIDANSQTSGIDHIIVMPNVGNNLIIGGLIEVTDPDNTEITSARAEIVGVVFTAERLTIDEAHGITASYWNGVMTLTGSATLAEYKEVLSTLNYQRTLLGTTMLTDRTVQITVNDGQLDSQVATITVLKRGSTLPAGMMAASQDSPSVQPQSVAARPVPNTAAASPQQEVVIAAPDQAAVELQQSGSAAPVEPQSVVLQWATSALAQSAVESSGAVSEVLQWQTSSTDAPVTTAISGGHVSISEGLQEEDVTEPADASQPEAASAPLYGSGSYSTAATEEAESGLGAGAQMMLMSVTSTPTIGASTNRITDYIYDAAGRLVYTLSDDTEDVSGVETTKRTVVEMGYDGASRLIREVSYAKRLDTSVALTESAIKTVLAQSTYKNDAANRATRYFYTSDGQRQGTLDAEGYLTEQKYDAAGRLQEQVRYATPTATSPTTLRTTGTLDQLRPALDATNDQATRQLYDARGQLVGSIDAMGYLTRYTYNTAGSVTEERRYAQAVVYDGSKILTDYVTEATPGSGLKSWIKAYAYDSLNRLVTLNESTLTNTTGSLLTRTTYEYNAVTGFLDRTTKAAELATTSLERRSTTFEYDALGRVLKEVGGEGSEVIRAAAGDAAAIASAYAAYGSRHEYDLAGRRIKTTEASGKVNLYFYDRDGRLRYTVSTGSTAGQGEVAETLYNALGEAEAITQYAATISVSGLTGGTNFTTVASRVASIVNPIKDRTTILDYTLRGQLKQKTDAESHITRQIYNAFGQLANRTTAVQLSSVSAAVDRLDTWTYDRKGLLKTSVLNSGGGDQAIGQTLSYDAFGRVIEKKDGMNRVWKTGYDQLGRQVTTADPLNNSTAPTTYDAFSRVLTQTDKLGQTTSYSYNTATAGRSIVTVTTPEGVVTTTTYDRHGSQVKIELQNNGVTEISTWWYDRNGRLTSQIIDTGSGRLNLTTASEYSKSGLLIGSLDANGIRTSYAYDAANRVMTRTVDPSSYPLPNGTTGTKTGALNLSTQYAYDAFGSVIKTTDAELVVTETIFDRKGQTVAVVVDTVQRANKPAPLLLATVYSYDTEGRTLELKEGVQAARVGGVLTYNGAATRTTQYVYDKAGRRTQDAVDPAGLNIVTSYAYDKNGNLYRKRDANGNDWRYVYDELNREVFTIDPLKGLVEKFYDAQGRVIRATQYKNLSTANVTEGASQDGTALTRIRDVIPYIKDSDNDRTTRFVYDADGRQVYQIDALGYVIENSYDKAGRITRVVEYAKAINSASLTDSLILSDVAPVANSADRLHHRFYDGAGRKIYDVSALKYVTKFQYDGMGRTKEVLHFARQLGAGVAMTGQAVHDAVTTTSFTIADQDQSTKYNYDSAGRVIEIFDADNYFESYEYDKIGNRISLTNKIGNQRSGSTAADVAWRAEHTWSYRYDGASRLIEEITPQEAMTVRNTSAAGLVATYYDNIDFSGASQQRIDTNVNFTTWATGSPVSGISVDTFSVRWTGEIQIPTAGAYTFYISADDGYRLYINDQIVVSKWLDQPGETSGTVTLAPGRNRIRLEYYEKTGSASIVLSWTGPGISTKQVIPAGQFFQGGYESVTQSLSTKYEYDGLGNLRKRLEAAGTAEQRTSEFFYDAAGRQTSVRHPIVNVYDPTAETSTAYLGRREKTETPGTRTWYDAQGQAIASQDRAGNFSYKFYDVVGRVEYEVDAQRYVTRYFYNSFGDVTALRRYAAVLPESQVETGSITLLTKEQAVRLAVAGSSDQNAKLGAAYSWVRTLMLAASTADSRTVTTDWDRIGRKAKVEQPEVHYYVAETGARGLGRPTVTYRYNAFGEIIEQKALRSGSADWVTTYFDYDLEGRQVRQLDAEAYQTFTNYDRFARVIERIEYAKAATGVAVVDGQLNFSALTQAVTGASLNDARGYDRKMKYTYDRMDRVRDEILENIRVSQYVTGTLTESVLSSKLVKHIDYDAVGNVVAVTDGMGATTRTYYDSLGRMRALASPTRVNDNLLGGSTTITPLTVFEYDRLGNVVVQSDFAQGASAATSTGYTAGAADSINDRKTTNYFDAVGQLIMTTGVMGFPEYYSYDALGRMAKKWSWQTDVDNGWSYQKTEIYSYDRIGRQVETMTVAQSPVAGIVTTRIKSTFNAFGERVGSETPYSGFTNSGILQEAALYDAAGRMWKSESGRAIKVYEYDLLGNLSAEVGLPVGNSISNPGQIAAATGANRVDYLRDDLGRVVEMRDVAFTVNTSPGGVSPAVLQQQTVAVATYFLVGTQLTIVGDDRFAPGSHYYTVEYLNSSGQVVTVTGSRPASERNMYVDLPGRGSGQPVRKVEVRAIIGGVQRVIATTDLTPAQIENPPRLPLLAFMPFQPKSPIGDIIGVHPFGRMNLTVSAMKYRVSGSSGAFSSIPVKAYDQDGWTGPNPKFQIDLTAINGAANGTYEYQFSLVGSGYELSPDEAIHMYAGFINIQNGVATFSEKLETLRPVTQYGVDRWGNIISATDPRNSSWLTEYRYDHGNRIIRTTRPTTDITSETGVTSVGRPVTYQYYDVRGLRLGERFNLIEGAGGNGYLRRWEYDAAGQITVERDAGIGIVKHYYDAFGRAVRELKADETRVERVYDRRGLLLRQANVSYIDGRRDEYAYDESGNRLSQATGVTNSFSGSVSRARYDTRGNIVQSITAMGFSTFYAYDELSRKRSETDPLLNSQTWAYDSAGQLQSYKDLVGVTTTYTYDDYGRLETQGNSSIQQTIDGQATTTHGQNLIYRYYENGWLKEIDDPALPVYNYEGYALENTSGYLSSYEYDLSGRRTVERYASTDAVAAHQIQETYIKYDALGRIARAHGVDHSVEYSYDITGNRRRVFSQYAFVRGEPVKSTDNWYTYDAENRITTSQGVLQGGAITINTEQGIVLGYDAAGNRRSARQYEKVEGETTKREISRTYRYDADKRLTYTYVVGTSGETETSRRTYDSAGRMTQYLDRGSNGTAELQIRNMSYDADDRLSLQEQYKISVTAGNLQLRVRYSDASNNSGYDAAGNLKVYRTEGFGSINYTQTYQYLYIRQGSQYKHAKIKGSGTASSGGFQPATTTTYYDANGNARRVHTNGGLANGFGMTTDSNGTIYRKQNPGENYFYAHAGGQQIGSYQWGGGLETKADFDFNYTPISDQYPPANTGLYIIQRDGETLQQAAHTIFGDANLWYLLADANGLSGNESLKAGTRLDVPNRITNLRNAFDTFKPVNVEDIIGDRTPQLKYIPPPPPTRSCNVFATILIVAVAVVATVLTAGAAATLMGVTSGGIMSTGMAALSGTLGTGLTGFAVGATAATVGGAVGSAAGQLTGMALGVQDHFSWSQVAVGGLAAGVTSGIGAGLDKIGLNPATAVTRDGVKVQGGLGQAGRGFAQGALNSAASQGINIALDKQDHFSWSQVAASALTNGLGAGLGNADPLNRIPGSVDVGMGGVIANGLRSTAYGVLNRTLIAAFDGKGKIDVLNIAADAFGNALGNSIVGAIKHANLPEEVKDLSPQGVAAYEQAKARGWDTDEAIIAGRRAHEAHREANGYGGANGTRYDGATFEGGRFTLRPEGPEAFAGPYDKSGIRTFAYHDSGFDPVESASLLGDEGIPFPHMIAGQRTFSGPLASNAGSGRAGRFAAVDPSRVISEALFPNIASLGNGGNPTLLGTAVGYAEGSIMNLASMAESLGTLDPHFGLSRGLSGFDHLIPLDQRLAGRALSDAMLPLGMSGGLAIERAVARGLGKLDNLAGLSRIDGIANPLPSDGVFSRVVPLKFAEAFARGEGTLAARSEVFIGAAEDLAGVSTPAQAQRRLSLYSDFDGAIPNTSGDAIVQFKLRDTRGLASPIETVGDSRGYGFVPGGRTAGGAREFIIQNGTAPEIGAFDIVVIPLKKNGSP